MGMLQNLLARATVVCSIRRKRVYFINIIDAHFKLLPSVMGNFYVLQRDCI